MDEFIEEVIERYDEYLMASEGRGISYGEIAHINGLGKEELNALYEEANEYLEIFEFLKTRERPLDYMFEAYRDAEDDTWGRIKDTTYDAMRWSKDYDY